MRHRLLRVFTAFRVVTAACLLASPAAHAQDTVDYAVPPLDEPPPEAPLPPPPPRMGIVPPAPSVLAPDARVVLENCTEPTFTDCFRLWEPPPPPPPPPPRQAAAPGADAPLPPGAPRDPAKPGGLDGGKPPPPNPAADKATYDALVDAIRDAGLQGNILLPDPPKDGGTVMTLDPTPKK